MESGRWMAVFSVGSGGSDPVREFLERLDLQT